MVHFADAVIERTIELRCPVAAGIDPRPELLSSELAGRFADSARGLARAYEHFGAGVLDGLEGIVPAVKIQIAFYEALGLPGVRAYAKTLRRAKEKGFLVIADIKRGDIGSTAEAYAAGHFGGRAEGLDADAVTLSPYLGGDSLRPFLADAGAPADQEVKGAFALVRTSNPSAREIQDLRSDGRPVYEHVARLVEEWGADHRGTSGYSALGAVVGATYPEELRAIRRAHPRMLLLIPGYGAQGGTAEDVAAALDERGAGALVASSRGILRGFRAAAERGLSPEEGIREEAVKMREDLRRAFETVRAAGTGVDPGRTNGPR